MSDDRQLQSALRRLEKICAERPELQQLGQINAALLKVLFRSAHQSSPLAPREESGIANRSNFATPQFRTTPPPIDASALKHNWLDVCSILSQNAELEPARRLADAVTSRMFDPAEQQLAVLSHGTEPFRSVLHDLELDEPLGITILRLSSLPQLAPIAWQYDPQIRAARWDGDHCPLCGGEPLLAELRGLEQLRWLRCGWCATQWQVDRLYCPFCNQRDHQHLHDLFLEGQAQGPRLATCDTCSRSLPTLATLDALTAPGLLVAEMETLHLRFLGE